MTSYDGRDHFFPTNRDRDDKSALRAVLASEGKASLEDFQVSFFPSPAVHRGYSAMTNTSFRLEEAYETTF